MTERLYTTKEAAYFLNIDRRTLDNWRSLRKGPVYVRVGNRIRYREAAIEEYLKTNTFHSRQPKQVAL